MDESISYYLLGIPIIIIAIIQLLQVKINNTQYDLNESHLKQMDIVIDVFKTNKDEHASHIKRHNETNQNFLDLIKLLKK